MARSASNVADVEFSTVVGLEPEEVINPCMDSPSELKTVDGGAANAGEGVAQPDYQPSLLMLVMLCAVSALEGADTQLLPVSMFALQKDIGLTLSDLAILNTAQLVMTNLAAPFWGTLADRGIVKRRTILVLGSLGQGLVTVLLSFVTSMGPMIFLRGLNGAFLASLRPISNGIIADSTSESRRGMIFGRVQSALLFGMFITTLSAGNMANKTVLGIQGWRVAFVISGLISAAVSVMVALFMVEPPREDIARKEIKGLSAVLDEIKSVARFFKIPTFGIMIMQGIFGTIPWSVMGNSLLYFKLCGMKDLPISILASEGFVMGLFGNILGGLVADSLARRFGYNGRPLSAQITVAIGIPCIFLQFWAIPPGEGSFAAYFLLIAGFGLLGSWAQSGTNFPILSDIVPSSDRSKVMAWECALENSVANAIGPIFVSTLATHAFGYTFGEKEANGQSLESAEALGKAMTVTICVPWMITLAAYTLLHWSYPRDMKRLNAERAEQAKACEEARAAEKTGQVS